MKTTQLTPEYDSAKCFYRKAWIIKDGESIKLQSYETIVAEYWPLKKRLKINGYYSRTTARHIREFVRQYAPFFPSPSKEEMIKTIDKTL